MSCWAGRTTYDAPPKAEFKSEGVDLCFTFQSTCAVYRITLAYRERKLFASNKPQLCVPPSFSNAFVVTCESADFFHKSTDYNYPEHERSLLWYELTVDIPLPFDGRSNQAAKDAVGKYLTQGDVFE